MQRRGEGHGCGVAAAAAEGGIVVVFIDALEARDQHDAVLIELPAKTLRRYAADAGGAVDRVCPDAHLPSRQAHNRQIHALKAYRHERCRLLFSGGEKHIQFPLGGTAVERRSLFEKFICRISLGGEDDHDVVSEQERLRDDARDVSHPLRILDGRAAEFLYDQH